jgi:hypothetical protein
VPTRTSTSTRSATLTSLPTRTATPTDTATSPAPLCHCLAQVVGGGAGQTPHK